MGSEPAAVPGEEIVRGRWPQMQAPEFRLLLRRWAEWRHGALVPHRADVVPAEVVPCLPRLWIFRLTEDRSRLVCTLAGEQLNEDWGFSIKGRDPVALWGPETGPVVNERLKRVAMTPGIIYGRSAIIPQSGIAGTLHAERLMLPLAGEANAPYGVLGITLFHRNRQVGDQPAVPPSVQAWLHPCADLPPGLPDP